MPQAPYRPVAPGSKGFTLIELIIAMAMVGLVAGAIFGVFLSSERAYNTQEHTVDAQQRVRVGIDFIAQDLRLAGLDPLGTGAAGIENAAATDLRFTADLDLDGIIDSGAADQERVTYDWAAGTGTLPGTGTLRRKFNEGTPNETGWTTLIDNVSALAFTYRDADGNVTAVPADIRMVDITMTCQGVGAKGQTISRTLSTRVICRNLDM